MEEMVVPFTIGHHDSKRPLPVSPQLLSQAQSLGYDLVTSPITTPHFHSRVLTHLSNFLSESADWSGGDITSSLNASPVQIAPLAPEDTPLVPGESISQTVGLTSSWIDLGSPDPVIADISSQVLRLELAYAAFCGITYVIISGPRLQGRGVSDSNIAQYARAILESLGQGPYMQFFIWLPMIDHAENNVEEIGDLAPFARARYLEDYAEDDKRVDLYGSWEVWDTVRSMCRYSPRLFVALSLPRLLPGSSVQSRWYSEPVRLLTLPATTFTKNAKGYPVLTKAHQTFITRLVHFRQPPVWFLLCDVGPLQTNENGSVGLQNAATFPTPAEASTSPQLKDPAPHLSYMRNLQNKQPVKSMADRFGAGYQDYLQAPLQPLTVHLESITYEVFEKDPIKYEWYERAIARALHDWVEQEKPTSNPDGRVVVAVVGAGRGPLVTRALQASEAVGVDIDIWALEKNPNAFVLLQQTNRNVWNDQVKLVKSDMRTWKGPARPSSDAPILKSFNLSGDDEEAEQMPADDTNAGVQNPTPAGPVSPSAQLATNYKIDILISELLGSFADNELSPECLDGVQHLLNPTHGISIPTSYTAHFTPIAAPKLHADIMLNMTSSVAHAAEIPYVVMFNAIDFLSTTEPPSGQFVEYMGETKLEAASASDFASRNDTTAVPTVASDAIAAPYHPAIIHQAWAFHHPNPKLPAITTTSATATSAPSNSHNARHCSFSFPVPNRGTCHGLAGYFETVLYQGVELSTNPLTMQDKSEDMISWFPIYFPLKRPLYIPDNSDVVVQMWRQTDDRKVWYEWIVDVYAVSDATRRGEGGHSRQIKKRTRIGGSELHSSEKEGCLM